ncbi:MAG: cobyric acid synthase [Methanomassiliicoccales archaeon]
MVMGATSGAGKSLVVMGLCRILADLGFRVAPFKSQNMSLNSYITQNGEEIARAQELQARAARAEPIAAMNPILLKPKGNAISQVVVEGRPYKDMDVQEYYGSFARSKGIEIIKRNFEILSKSNDFVIIEGAGSPAEINLGDQEIANIPTARISDADCILVVNIEWGGAFAYLYGTLLLLNEEDRKKFKGVIINNMHGDHETLEVGIKKAEKELGIKVLGVLPHLDLELPTEDSMFLKDKGAKEDSTTLIGIIRLPRISNFTDFDPFTLEEGISVVYIDDPNDLDNVDLIIIPGTKNTVQDLIWMNERGLSQKIRSLKGKMPIIGICGGYQMLGTEIHDLYGLEGGQSRSLEGIGLLQAQTVFDSKEKRTVQVEGELLLGKGGKVRGYEIHMGRTTSLEAPVFYITSDGGYHEGSVSTDGMVLGTYLHGVFDLPAFRQHVISLIKADRKSHFEEAKNLDSAVENSISEVARIMKKRLILRYLIPEVGGVSD